MGWGSATELFDEVIDAVLEYLPDSTCAIGEREWTLYKIWSAFTDADWDAWEDSKHIDLLVPILNHYEPDLIVEG